MMTFSGTSADIIAIPVTPEENKIRGHGNEAYTIHWRDAGGIF